MPLLKKYFRTVLTTRLLLESNEQFLFLEQSPLNGGGFTLPGGKIEKEEFAKDALVREASEEIGISIKKKHLQLVHVTHRKSGNMSEIILFFYCTANPTEAPVSKEPHKFQQTVWLPMNEVPEGLTDVLKNAIESVKKGKFFSQFPKENKKVKASVEEEDVVGYPMFRKNKKSKQDGKTIEKQSKKEQNSPLMTLEEAIEAVKSPCLLLEEAIA